VTAASDTSTLTYVYGVTWAATPLPDGVTAIVHGDLAAVTRPIEPGELRARRRDLLRHAEVLQQVFDRGTVVPLQFGVVVGDAETELLEPRRDELTRLLRSLDGDAEVTLRAYYREEDVLRSLLAADRRLEQLRGSASPVQLGEAVAHALHARRDADAAAIVRELRPFARDAAVDDVRTELEVFRGAFLVARDALDEFDAAADALARAHAATTTFKYTGPLPPHHFVALGSG
jgi:hypothetical protein